MMDKTTLTQYLITQTNQKIRKEELYHLKTLILNDSEMLFTDYVNICDVLYDGINIDKNTIYMLNNNFSLYNVEPQSFYFYYRNKLIMILPTYYKMIENDTRKELLSISNNRNYRRLAQANIQKALNTNKNKNEFNRDESNDTTYNGSDNINNKEAYKESPMSVEAEDFDSLFNWETSTSVKEIENSEKNNHTEKNTNKIKDINDSIQTIKNITNNLNDTSELTEGATILAVEAIEKISNYLINNNNKAQFYLINNVRPCFINVY